MAQRWPEMSRRIGDRLTGTLDDPAAGIGKRFESPLVACWRIVGTVPQADLHVGITRQHATPPRLTPLWQPGQRASDGRRKSDRRISRSPPLRKSSSSSSVSSLQPAICQAADLLCFGQIDVHATLSGPLRDPAQLQAHVEIPKNQRRRYKTQQITANAKPCSSSTHRNRAVTIQPTELTSAAATDLTLQGYAIPLSNAAPLTVSAEGKDRLHRAPQSCTGCG